MPLTVCSAHIRIIDDDEKGTHNLRTLGVGT